MNAVVKQRAPTERQQVQQIEGALKVMQERLVAALPVHVSVRQFTATVLTAVSTNTDLLACDRHSLFLSCMKAARDGLLPDGREAALVPYKDKQKGKVVVYMPMVAGLLKKVRNSGELSSLSAHAVYANDEFSYELGDNERITHKPVLRGERGELVAAYAIARIKDGGTYRAVLNERDIELIKSASRSAESGPWSGPFEPEMWKKSAIRRLAKILPQSTDINNYLQSGPALPAQEAAAPLPDGDDPLRSAEYELRTRALLALRDESGDMPTLQSNWEGIKAEYRKIDTEVPAEIEDAFNLRREALEPAKA